ncbi:unnamed protein product, partial [Candidula unifasciata]
SSYGQLGDGSVQDGSSGMQQLQQQESQSFLSVMSTTASCVSSPSAVLAASKNTDAAVAQILKNISNSMAESSGMLADNSDMVTSRAVFGNTSLDSHVDRTHVYQPFQGYPSSFSKSFKDSIKQDVMLSSTVDSDMNHLSAYHSDPLARDEVPYSLKPGRLHVDGQNNKRRLSADLESHRTSSCFLYKPHSGISPHSMLVSPLEVEGLIPGRTRVRSKSGDINYKYVRSKSVDHSPMRPRSFTEDSLFRSNKRIDGTFIKGGKISTPEQDLFSRSDGAGVFRNPSSLPTSLKIKRKHRPAPLYIPPQFGIFQSRLRSPRVIGREGHLSTERGRGHTPPPYTPPPMLSPFRSGSGLFCTLQSTQPQTPRSAPVTGRVLLSQRGSFGSGRLDLSFNLAPDQTTDDDVPETDTTAHINVGADYQAVLPELRVRSWTEASDVVDDRRALLWEPSSQRDNTDSQMQCYQDFSCTAAVRGNGCNVEYALHLLHLANGDISEAMLMLMADPPMLPVGHPMLDYKYQESDSWNSNEMERFYRSIMIHDKDFFKVSKDVGTKSVKQCVQFYYVWKKVCPDDYRRLRSGRGKQNDYNTRRSAVKTTSTAPTEKVSQVPVVSESQVLLAGVAAVEGVEENVESVDSDNTSLLSDNDETSMAPDSVQSSAANTACSTPTRVESPTPLPPPQFTCTFEGCHVTCSSKQSLKRHQRKHLDKPPQSSPSVPRKPRPTTPSRSPVYDQFGEEVFPCRICGRVFAKVKSRSAHMKSHKIAEQAQQEKKAAEMAIASQAFANA